ncbi:MAG: hypothetical protein D6698_12945 [Gammaproteobacteria bacterium]|nr:MAG: hypothetical protein D6698_12945 [Gammaproteobacteria bacterium]
MKAFPPYLHRFIQPYLWLAVVSSMIAGCASNPQSAKIAKPEKKLAQPSASTYDPDQIRADLALLRAFNSASPELKTAIFQLRSSNPYQQIKGIRNLRRLVPESAIAVPALLTFLSQNKSIALHLSPFDKSDENLTSLSLEALETLIAIGQPAVPDLIRKISDPDPLVRRRAIYALGEIAAPEALKPLEGIKREPDPRVRAVLHSAIKKIRARYPGSIEQVGL